MLMPNMSPNEIKALALLMHKKYGATQKDVAIFFKKSQSTISQWVKEAEYLFQINQLNKELERAEIEIQKLRQLPSPSS